MKKISLLFVLIIVISVMAAGAVAADQSDARPVLYTYYRQMGWGDRVQIGWLDESGAVRTVSGHDAELKWPYQPEEQLAYLEKTEDFSESGVMNSDDLFAVKSLILSVEDQGSKTVPAANDAGTEKSYAVRYSREGEPEVILLGVSGDDYFENFDPNAQALYRLLRVLFSDVTHYAYSTPVIGPQGFVPVPLSEFAGIDPDAVLSAEISGIYEDCEVGGIPLEMTDEDIAELRSLIRSGRVLGKADSVISTGGPSSYYFHGPDGELIGSVSFENGLLVKGDGHYYYDKQ